MAHECIQGDSFAYDFSCDELPTFDANWSGKWAIIEGLDDISDGNDIVTIAEGDLIRSSNNSKLELRLAPTVTEAIAVGYYLLIVQITNTAIAFNQEVMQEEFKVTVQGIAI